MNIALTTLGLIGAGILRSVAGWAENALEDGKITKYEVAQLFSTIVRIGIIGLGTAYGLGLEPLAATGSAVVLDFVLKALKAKKK